MNQITKPFLQRIRQKVAQNGYISLDLPDQHGLLILPQGCSTKQQIHTLQQLLLDLKYTNGSPPSTRLGPRHDDLDCQVTVEERNQLFNFLHP